MFGEKIPEPEDYLVTRIRDESGGERLPPFRCNVIGLNQVLSSINLEKQRFVTNVNF